ncbi:uncharacterized protein L969DRAFT_89785 [Mixia osmundae IAM 14324]|uniref:uncharacterized protein n=1 Tax=Mixia osmundae (strain CBS 9802 / IAM 14324 / JCM 22182 / KY 12970) TaxID=764103 RepID=UPI0004A54DF2|nr:uncharacterized protein L969DRAFT_89785 [Mixia osmundae IAM 14324]KEI37238.1 hypothetical protein L969DRAFT_89785 [Mixia osmundae IAM 14324]
MKIVPLVTRESLVLPALTVFAVEAKSAGTIALAVSASGGLSHGFSNYILPILDDEHMLCTSLIHQLSSMSQAALEQRKCRQYKPGRSHIRRIVPDSLLPLALFSSVCCCN